MLSPSRGASARLALLVGVAWLGAAAVAAASETGGGNADSVELHWAYRPPVDHPVPRIRDQGGIRNRLDTFLVASLETRHQAFSPPADRRTLVRRVTFDLTGLPPTAEQVETFERDPAPDAFERVVERLLASPHYGERWGRHWLDVARYADSNGMDENAAHGNAWRYRDYVVGSFNRDKPFDQFLVEQLAGDLMAPKEPGGLRHELLSALGFLAIGPKVLAEPDKVKMELDIIDEQIDAVGRAVCGMTLGCARCHDHKFDPVSMDDYYGLVAIFKSTRTMDDLTTIAKWHEPLLALPADHERLGAHVARVAAGKAAISNLVAEANAAVRVLLGSNGLPAQPEKHYPAATVGRLKSMREELAVVEAAAPELPSTMGVTESTNILRTFPVLMRGNPLTPGREVTRRIPAVLGAVGEDFPDGQSGRMELARWLANPRNPLTARVMVNRIWRWHFGMGIVPTPDNFGRLGGRPTHPELLDWLACRFVESGWSVKAMHRLILGSAAYQQSAGRRATGPAIADDVPTAFLARFPVRRLSAEEFRDAMLAVGGLLDLKAGGRPMPHKNRELVFNHTSTDATTYTSRQRSLYLPVIRNHVYDVFELLDFPDPAQQVGDRATTTVPSQALFFMNGDLMMEAASALADSLASAAREDEGRIGLLYERALGRRPTGVEMTRAVAFLERWRARESSTPPSGAGQDRPDPLAALCQVVLSSNEFLYIE